jgi:WD40 repeat protein
VPPEPLSLVASLPLGAPVATVRFHPNRRVLVAALAGKPELRFVRYDKQEHIEPGARVDLSGTPFDAIALSPARDLLVTCGRGRRTEAWDTDLPSRKPKSELSWTDATALGFLRKGEVLVLGLDGRAPLLEHVEFRRLAEMRTSGAASAIAQHTERRVFVLAAAVEGGSDVFFGRIGLRERTLRFTQHDVRYAVGFPVCAAGFSHDGRTLALVGGMGGVVDVETVAFPPLRRRVRRRAIEGAPGSPGPADGIAFDPIGAAFWLGDPTGHLSLVDVGTGEVVNRIAAHEGPVTSLDVRYTRRMVATGGADGLVKLWELPDAPPSRGYSEDAQRPITEEFKAWHPLWEGEDVASMRALGSREP